ncbi:UNKNOWN [Stylonychia lemnae]|uniref:Uncharacterized protein n=1 Tax=Stylonychia lemnae TaxID=5949 RepID=A0A078APA2_STYLE|nr:UNKNOWN [Stylonychia lemnae]|eukprot:CDW83766.1 UNKNOWN [Stylonychia lemnae]
MAPGNSIWIEHWNNFDYKMIQQSQVARILIIRQEIKYSIQYMARGYFTRMHSSRQKYSRFSCLIRPTVICQCCWKQFIDLRLSLKSQIFKGGEGQQIYPPSIERSVCQFSNKINPRTRLKLSLKTGQFSLALLIAKWLTKCKVSLLNRIILKEMRPGYLKMFLAKFLVNNITLDGQPFCLASRQNSIKREHQQSISWNTLYIKMKPSSIHNKNLRNLFENTCMLGLGQLHKHHHIYTNQTSEFYSIMEEDLILMLIKLLPNSSYLDQAQHPQGFQSQIHC